MSNYTTIFYILLVLNLALFEVVHGQCFGYYLQLTDMILTGQVLGAAPGSSAFTIIANSWTVPNGCSVAKITQSSSSTIGTPLAGVEDEATCDSKLCKLQVSDLTTARTETMWVFFCLDTACVDSPASFQVDFTVENPVTCGPAETITHSLDPKEFVYPYSPNGGGTYTKSYNELMTTVTSTGSCPTLGIVHSTPTGGSTFLGTQLADMLDTYNAQDPSNPTITSYVTYPFAMAIPFMSISSSTPQCINYPLTVFSSGYYLSNELIVRLCICGKETVSRKNDLAKQIGLTSDFGGAPVIAKTKAQYLDYFEFGYTDPEASDQCVVDYQYLTRQDTTTQVDSTDPISLDPSTGDIMVILNMEMPTTTYYLWVTTMGMVTMQKSLDLTITLQDHSSCDPSVITQGFPFVDQIVGNANSFFQFMADFTSTGCPIQKYVSFQTGTQTFSTDMPSSAVCDSFGWCKIKMIQSGDQRKTFDLNPCMDGAAINPTKCKPFVASFNAYPGYDCSPYGVIISDLDVQIAYNPAKTTFKTNGAALTVSSFYDLITTTPENTYCPITLAIKFTTDIHSRFGSTLEDFNKERPDFQANGLIEPGFDMTVDPMTLVGNSVKLAEFNLAYVSAGLRISNTYASVSICLCGDEILSTDSTEAHSIAEVSSKDAFKTIDVATYEAFFVLDFSAANSQCEIINFALTSDESGTAFTDDTVITMDPTTKELKISLTEALSAYTVYLEATTFGDKKAYKKLSIEVANQYASCDPNTMTQDSIFVQNQILYNSNLYVYFIGSFSGNCPVEGKIYQRVKGDPSTPEPNLSEVAVCGSTDTKWCYFLLDSAAGLTPLRSVSIDVYACMDFTFAQPLLCKSFQLDFEVTDTTTCGLESINGSPTPQPPEIAYDLDTTAGSVQVFKPSDYLSLVSSNPDCPVKIMTINKDVAGYPNYGDSLAGLSSYVTSTGAPSHYPTIDYATDYPLLEISTPTDTAGCSIYYVTGVSVSLRLSYEDIRQSVCVCGNENVSSMGSSYPIDYYQTPGQTQTIDQATYKGWFTLDTISNSAIQSDQCIIQSFKLLKDDMSDCDSSCNITLVGDTLTTSLDEPMSQTTYFLQATTRGQKTATQELVLKIEANCAIQTINIDKDVTELVLNRTTDAIIFEFQLSDYFEFSSSNEFYCPIKQGKIWYYTSFNPMVPETYDENYANLVYQKDDIANNDITLFKQTVSQQYPQIVLMRLQMAFGSNITQINADFRIVVCGDELIKTSGNDTIEHPYQIDVTDPSSIELSEYSEWFTMLHESEEINTRLLSSPNCTIDSYKLCEDQYCSIVLPNFTSKSDSQYFWMKDTDIGFRVDEMYTKVVYIAATTIGLVTQTKPLLINVGCGAENVTSAYPYFYNESQQFNNGTVTLNFSDWFQSDINFTLCPITNYYVSSVGWIDLKVYVGEQIGEGKQITDQSEINETSSYEIMDHVLLREDKTIQIATDNMTEEGVFYLNLTAKTISNQTGFTFIKLVVITDVIKQCPIFKVPPTKITLLLADLKTPYLYSSGKATDVDGDDIVMKFTIPSKAKSFIKMQQKDDKFFMILDKSKITKDKSGSFKLAVVLSDESCIEDQPEYPFVFEIVWAVPVEDETGADKASEDGEEDEAAAEDEKEEDEADEEKEEEEDEDEEEAEEEEESMDELADSAGAIGGDVEIDAMELYAVMNVVVPEIEIPPTPVGAGVIVVEESRPPDMVVVSKKDFDKGWKSELRAARLKKLIESKWKQIDQMDKESESVPEKKKPAKELDVKIPQMSRDGFMKCTFTNKMKVPAFVANSKEEKRRLEAIEDEFYKNGTYRPSRPRRKLVPVEELDINRDLMNVVFYLKSDVKVEDIGYYLVVKTWTADVFEIGIVITTPMLISQGIQRDEVEMTVKNPYLFESLETGEMLDVSKMRFYQTLPRQLPEGMAEEDIEETAHHTQLGMTALVILQIVVQFFMKQNMADMMICIFTIQLCCFYTFYATNLPGNAEIYLQEFREMVKMDAIQPDNLLKVIDEDLSVNAILGLGQERLNNAIESTGIKTVNPGANLATFLQIIAACICFFLFLLFCFLVLPKLRPIVEIKIKGYLNATYYNGIISGQKFAFLQASIAFGINYKVIDWDKPFKEIYPKFIPLGIFLVYPCLCILLLRKYRLHLNEKKVMAKIGNLYNGLKVKKDGYQIYYQPVWLYRRFVFVLIPLTFEFNPSIQLISLLFLNVFYVMFYQGVRPHIQKSSVQLEAVNEALLVLMSYHMFCFTWFVQTKEQQFLIGYSFLGNLLLILSYNIGVILRKKQLNALSERRKTANQLAYENAFRLWIKGYKVEKKQKLIKRGLKRTIRNWENDRIKEIIVNLRGPVHLYKDYAALGDIPQKNDERQKMMPPLRPVQEESLEESHVTSGTIQACYDYSMIKEIDCRPTPRQKEPLLQIPVDESKTPIKEITSEMLTPNEEQAKAEQLIQKVLKRKKRQIIKILDMIDELYTKFINKEDIQEEYLESSLLELDMTCSEVLQNDNEKAKKFKNTQKVGIIEQYVLQKDELGEYSSDIDIQSAKQAEWRLKKYFKMLHRALKKIDQRLKFVALNTSLISECPDISSDSFTDYGTRKMMLFDDDEDQMPTNDWSWADMDTKLDQMRPPGQDYDIMNTVSKKPAPNYLWDMPKHPLTPVEIFTNRQIRQKELHQQRYPMDYVPERRLPQRQGNHQETGVLLAFQQVLPHVLSAQQSDDGILSDEEPSKLENSQEEVEQSERPTTFFGELGQILDMAIQKVRMDDALAEMEDYASELDGDERKEEGKAEEGEAADVQQEDEEVE